ncbi:LOW QUALITY PROTEIN: strictosidine-O-beta-D-glucosidase-like [Rutidosis leptorrhynchoides]|uniref:LOW QUALITY PROTEIN: strictosidine-O-beta-D-glucosidase-like n=1 Tax=Rutidosis leptorrhynchoides TaxID=125765 RepID=UPI003A98E093
MVEFDRSCSNASDIKRIDFPDDFVFGVGSSAYQVEGSWRADGKGLSIWDTFALRHPDKIEGGANGCHSNENYSRMKEDVQLLKKMGINSYRFSISWSRILPGGKVSMGTSTEGINHYNKLIDELLANGIQPFVTLFHWDLPNALEEEYMGFLSSKIVDDFVNYADICFWEFGDRVKNWVTINEPCEFTVSGYVAGRWAPGRGGDNEDGDPQTEPYTVAYNLLNCHAAAYRKYCEGYKDIQKGKVGITLNSNYFQPYNGPSDVQAVKYAFDFQLGWFLEPLTKGNWPESMLTFAQTPTSDYPNGRVLPTFSSDQLTKLINSYDFLGINYYTSNYARLPTSSDKLSLGYSTDCHYVASGQDPDGNNIGEPSYEGSWIYLCPQQLTELLVYIKETYKVTTEIFITENGSSDENDAGKTYEQVRNDTYRMNYIKEHLKAIRNAREKQVNVMGYFVWSFMDSFEWSAGYSVRFGLIYVDYLKDLQRYPKNSALWYKKFLYEDKKRSLTESENKVRA